MKKIISVLFLAAALVAPAFADRPNMELVPKIGYLFAPEITFDGNSSSKDSAISIGAEFFVELQENFLVGGGLMWGDNTK